MHGSHRSRVFIQSIRKRFCFLQNKFEGGCLLYAKTEKVAHSTDNRFTINYGSKSGCDYVIAISVMFGVLYGLAMAILHTAVIVLRMRQSDIGYICISFFTASHEIQTFAKPQRSSGKAIFLLETTHFAKPKICLGVLHRQRQNCNFDHTIFLACMQDCADVSLQHGRPGSEQFQRPAVFHRSMRHSGRIQEVVRSPVRHVSRARQVRSTDRGEKLCEIKFEKQWHTRRNPAKELLEPLEPSSAPCAVKCVFPIYKLLWVGCPL